MGVILVFTAQRERMATSTATIRVVTHYRKRSLVVDAVNFDGANVTEIREFTADKFDLHDPLVEDADSTITASVYDVLHQTWIGVSPGDWIIRGVAGEYYPCNATVFHEIYELATHEDVDHVTTPSQAPRPTVGRVVHYVSFGTPGGEYHSACRAALVTEVSSCGEHGHIGLCVLNPTGIFFRSLGDGGCTYHEGDSEGGRLPPRLPGGSWHWPERADAGAGD